MAGKSKNINKLKEKVENLGVVIEKFGRTPIEGRVFAYLLLANPPYRSFDDIVEFLNAGKSSISNALNMFQREGTILYRTFSGDRKRYFMIDTKGWHKSFADGVKNLSDFNHLLEDVLKFRKGTDEQKFNDDLRELLDFQTYISEEIAKAIIKWNKR